MGYGVGVAFNNIYAPADGNYLITLVGCEGGGDAVLPGNAERRITDYSSALWRQLVCADTTCFHDYSVESRQQQHDQHQQRSDLVARYRGDHDQPGKPSCESTLFPTDHDVHRSESGDL